MFGSRWLWLGEYGTGDQSYQQGSPLGLASLHFAGDVTLGANHAPRGGDHLLAQRVQRRVGDLHQTWPPNMTGFAQ